MSVYSSEYLDDIFPTLSVFYIPEFKCDYDVDDTLGPIINTYTTLNTRTITATTDTAGKNYSLTIGATSNMILEALDAFQSYSSKGFNYYTSTSWSNTEGGLYRADDLIMGVARSADCNFTNISMPRHNVEFAFSNTFKMNTTFINTDLQSYDTLGTSKASFVIGNTTSFNSNVAIKGNMVAYGSVFGRDLNLWSTKTGTEPTDPNKIGYGFRMNSDDQLELVKISTFNDSTQYTKRVAIFGMSEIPHGTDDPNSSDYLVFNALNSTPVGTYSNGSLVSAVSPLDKVMFVSQPQGYIGVGTLTPQYGFDVAKVANFRNDVTVLGNFNFGNSLVPATANVGSVGTVDKPMNSLYLGTGGMTVGQGGLATVLQNQPFYNANGLFVSDVNNTPTTIWCSNIQLYGGDLDMVSKSTNGTGKLLCSNAVVTNLTTPNLTVPNVGNVATLNARVLSASNATVLGTLGALDIVASNVNVGVMLTASNVNVGVALTASNVSVGQVLTASNIFGTTATIHTINVVEQIVTPGADYAEFVAKSDPAAAFKCGQVVGLDAKGEITAAFADAFHFMVVSTAPSIVGGRLDDSDEFAASNEKLAFCGRVPIICSSCQVGDYIVPVPDPQGGITASAVSAHHMTLPQYMSSVGHVVTFSNDLPIVVVKQ